MAASFSHLTMGRRLARPPDSRQVVRGGRQNQLHRHLRQAATSESPHHPLLFQDSEHRLRDRLGPLVNFAVCRGPLVPWRPPMGRIMGPVPQLPLSIQPTRARFETGT